MVKSIASTVARNLGSDSSLLKLGKIKKNIDESVADRQSAEETQLLTQTDRGPKTRNSSQKSNRYPDHHAWMDAGVYVEGIFLKLLSQDSKHFAIPMW